MTTVAGVQWWQPLVKPGWSLDRLHNDPQVDVAAPAEDAPPRHHPPVSMAACHHGRADLAASWASSMAAAVATAAAGPCNMPGW